MATIQKTKDTLNSMVEAEMRKTRELAIKAYEKNLVEGSYSIAAQIAKDFGLGKEEKIAAATKAYETC